MFWTLIAPKRVMIRYEIFRTSIVSAHCASCMTRWPLLRRMGLHILSWDRAFIFNLLIIWGFVFIILMICFNFLTIRGFFSFCSWLGICFHLVDDSKESFVLFKQMEYWNPGEMFFLFILWCKMILVLLQSGCILLSFLLSMTWRFLFYFIIEINSSFISSLLRLQVRIRDFAVNLGSDK